MRLLLLFFHRPISPLLQSALEMPIPHKIPIRVLLIIVFAVLSELLLRPATSFAGNVLFYKGEGGLGFDAQLKLDEQLALNLIGCRNFGKSRQVQFGLYVKGERLSPELRSIADAKDQKLNLHLCANETCEERSWELLESGTGDTYFTKVVLPRYGQHIESFRIVLPKETRKYEYRGNIEGVLQRICR